MSHSEREHDLKDEGDRHEGTQHVGAADGHVDGELAALIAAGRTAGYLTFDQVNAYLPDEAVDPEKIDALLHVGRR
jgi:hypothetical protein